MSAWWWLSFARDGQFRGAAIVRGNDIGEATTNAWMKGINPGGEVMGVRIPEEFSLEIYEARWCNRLLTRVEAMEFDGLLLRQ